MLLKRLSVIVILCCIGTVLHAASPSEGELRQQLASYLQNQYASLEDSPLPSGVFYDLVLPLSQIGELNGKPDAPVINIKRWLQAAHELRRASIVESPLPSHFELRQLGNDLAKEHVYPIAMLNYRYEHVKTDADPDKVIGYENDRAVSLDETAIESASMFAASTLRDWSYRGSNVQFRIDTDSFYFTNLKSPLESMEIDFDDGLGFRTVDDKSDVTIRYNSTGKKTITVKAVQSDGIELNGSFRFEIRSLDAPAPHETWQLTATIPHEGVYAEGEAYIYLSDQHATLTNPVILAEGLDLGNVLNWDELYELMNTQNLLEDLRTLGYDAVVLNYTESTTYCQANGYLVVELMNQVNQVIPNGTTSVLVGTSMGGLTTRFALTYMETHSQPHNVRTWISFDAPHTGANIPLGIQYWANFFASQSAEAEASRDALNSPAAKQLLVTHFTDPASSIPSPDPLRAGFMSELNSMGGYPDQTRRVAVANGSGTMQGVGFNPGDQIILWEYRSFLVDIDGNVWAQHNTQTATIFDGEINLIWPLPDENQTVTEQPTWPWDNAPGGLSPTMQELADVEAPYGDIVALHPSHCFIPSISSLDLAVATPFFDIAGDPDLLSLSSFDTLYYPVENQEHVTITEENYEWFMQEIIEELDVPVVTISVVGDSVRLRWQPVLGAQSYRIYESEDSIVWPEVFAVTSDTTWIVSIAESELGFLRVVASR